MVLHASPVRRVACVSQRRATRRSYELADLHHAIGTGFCGALAAFLAWIFSTARTPPALVVGWGVLLLIFWVNFQNTRVAVQRTDNLLIEEVKKWRLHSAGEAGPDASKPAAPPQSS